MDNLTTVVYYTSNRENEIFEERIRRTVRHMSRPLPIVSVSQKPMDFGTNICVGEVGSNQHNAKRQLLIGAVEAKTKFVTTVEADFICPKEYFNFRPERDDTIYFAEPMYVLFARRGKIRVFALKPKRAGYAIVANRDLLVEKFEEMLQGRKTWENEDTQGNYDLANLWDLCRSEYFHLDIPIISFRTDNGMHKGAPYRRNTVTTELPGFGSASRLVRRYFNA